jgi:hypothetical protein
MPTRRIPYGILCALPAMLCVSLSSAPSADLTLRPAAHHDAMAATPPVVPAASTQTTTAGAPSSHQPSLKTVTPPRSSTSTTSQAAASSPGTNGSAGACTIWAEPSNDDENQIRIPGLPTIGTVPVNPSIDLTRETMSTSRDDTTLVIRMYVADLEKQVPVGFQGLSWTTTWGQGDPAMTIFAKAVYRSDGSTMFVFGPSLVQVPGSLVTGPGGYAELDVPLSAPGAPAIGEVAYQPNAIAQDDVVDQDTPAGWFSSGTSGDSAGPQNNYVVGTRC